MTRAGLIWGAGALVCAAIFAGWRDARRRRRVDLDRVGAIDWPTVQMLALIALAVTIGLIVHA